MKIFKKNKYNTDFGEKILVFNSNDAKEFNKNKRYFLDVGYKIKKIILADDGQFKLLAVIKKKKLHNCLLKDQQVDPDDKTIPRQGTYPEYCDFYYKGTCLYCCGGSCLYQDTRKNISIIKDMVNRYKEHTKDNPSFYNKSRSYYEDTEYGRIFSRSFEHLNANDEEDKEDFSYPRGIYTYYRR